MPPFEMVIFTVFNGAHLLYRICRERQIFK